MRGKWQMKILAAAIFNKLKQSIMELAAMDEKSKTKVAVLEKKVLRVEEEILQRDNTITALEEKPEAFHQRMEALEKLVKNQHN